MTKSYADGGAVLAPTDNDDPRALSPGSEAWAHAIADRLYGYGKSQPDTFIGNAVSFGANALAELPETLVSAHRLARAPSQLWHGQPVDAGLADLARVGSAALPLARPLAPLIRPVPSLGRIPVDRTGAAERRIHSLLRELETRGAGTPYASGGTVKMSSKTNAVSRALNVAQRMRKASGGAVGKYADGGVPDWRSDMDAPKPHYHPVTGEWIDPGTRGPEVLTEAPRARGALDAVLDYGAMPAKVATSVAMQPVTAGIAVNEAIQDPTIPNVTNAGMQSAMAFLQPMKALKLLGLGYGAAAAKDAGLTPFGAAQAEPDGPLTPDQMKRLVALQKKLERGALSRAEREEQNTLMGMQRDYAAAAARAKFEAQARRDAMDAELTTKRGTLDAEAEAARKAEELAEYNRAVKGAERARDTELARDRRFSDTEMGKVWDKTGGWGPALVGAGLGGLSRAATGGGSAVKDYILPSILGGVGGAASNNIPLAYNAFGTEPDNPQKRAFEAYSRELPPGHPRKEEFAAYAEKLPRANPVREVAGQELYDWDKAKERMLFGAVEGVGGGLFGADMVRMPGRILDMTARAPGRLMKGWHEGMEEASNAAVGSAKARAKALKAGQSLQDSRRVSAADRLAADEQRLIESEAQRRLGAPAGGSGQSGAAGNPRPLPSDAVLTSPSTSPSGLRSKPSPSSESSQPRQKKVAQKAEQAIDEQKREKAAKELSRFLSADAPALPGTDVPTVIYKTPRKHGGKVTGWYTRAENGRFRGGAVKSGTEQALETARKYAAGGAVLVGPVVGATGGRTDALPVSVPNGAFVIPADVVSAVGEGNSLSGMDRLKQQFGEPSPRGRASGGAVPIKISDGEFVLSPDQVAKIGGGDMDRGHAILDRLILKLRGDHIKTLQALPGPAKGDA